MLASLSYQSVLRRGFALVRDAEGRAVRQATGLGAGVRLEIELADGRIAAETLAPSAVPPPSGAPARPAATRPAAAKKTTPSGGSQGTLF